MFSLSASYVGEKIAKGDGTANKQLLVLTIILLVVWLLLNTAFIYYLWQFKKAKLKTKMYGWPLISVSAGLSFVMLICWVLNLPFYLKAASIFGSENANTAFGTVVALLVIGYVSLLFLMIVFWFFIARFAVGFDDQEILFIGEKIMYSKITKVIKDDKKKAIYINYLQGRRTHKRQKFYLKSTIGQFVLKNIELTGYKAEVGDEDQYFKKVIAGKNVNSENKTEENKKDE